MNGNKNLKAALKPLFCWLVLQFFERKNYEREKKFGPFRPVLNKWEEREKSIKEDKPAVFNISRKFPINLQKPLIDDIWDNFRTNDRTGKDVVRKYDREIMRHSQKNNMDPDLVRAVMYAENARGHKFGLNSVADSMRLSESVMPMNIQKNRWSDLVGKKPDDMYDADNNIETATVLLSRIRNRVEKPTPEKIGSLWHSLAREETDEFGEFIGQAYREKPWAKFE